MIILLVFGSLGLGIFLGAILTRYWMQTKSQQDRLRLQNDLTLLQERLAHKEAFMADLTATLTQKEQLAHTFQALCSETLQKNNEHFLRLAQTSFEKFHHIAQNDLEQRKHAITEVLKPVQTSLDRVDKHIHDLEKTRVGAYEALNQQVHMLIATQEHLRKETNTLTQALRAPNVHGRWGEIQLRRVVEIAGMVNQCDFFEQESAESENGKLRPDMLIRLPGQKHIVVDAKAPLSAYLDACQTDNEHIRTQKLADFVRYIRTHIMTLSKKEYWSQFQPTPEFVVMFLPGESFFSAALAQDPGLIEMGAENRVILATPTTLLSLLRAVAYGWQQESITKHATYISELGKELYKRLSDLSGHFERLGRALGQSVESYNKAMGSLESRVLVTARKFHELQGGGAPESENLPTPASLEVYPKISEISEPEVLNPPKNQDPSVL